jgi:hypothetical protein
MERRCRKKRKAWKEEERNGEDMGGLSFGR